MTLRTVRVPEKFAPLFEQAQEYVTRYFADQVSTPEHGTLEVCGQRYVLVRAASMSVEFHEMVRSFYSEDAEAGAAVHALLFDVAHAMGLADANTFADRMEVEDPIARLSAGPVHFAHAGWAFVDISAESTPSPDENYYLLYDHPYSFESDSWIGANKTSERPVCVMSAGYSSGWCESSFGLPLVAVEILCRAKGDAACRFIMAPANRIEAHIARYAERHPDLRSRLVGYQVPGFFSKRTDRQLLRRNLELEQRAQERALELAATNEQLKRDIAERERTESALSASKELTERLIEALPGGVVHVTREGAIARANVEACRILGLGYDELSRRYVSDFEPETIFEDGTPAKADEYPVSRAMMTGLPQPATTLGVRKPDGQISWAVFRAVPTRDANQTINGAVVTFLDITERKHFEDKLRHAQKLESLGVLAGGIAHDFNNLLVSILGNASLAKTLPNCPPELSQLLDDIEIGARRAAELTKQMLDYAGQGKVRVQSIHLPSVVREMTKLLHALIPKHVELRHHFQEDLPSIEADPTQIRQVIMNLVTNAAEAMLDRTGRVVVSLEERYVGKDELTRYLGDEATPGTFVCLEVEDAGAGMTGETVERIFDPFFTTKFMGRGLGMAAVLGIVRSHQGAIRIESREGEGTRVVVLLPTKGGERSMAPRASEKSLGTILVVDDDDGVRMVAKRSLLAHGYDVLVAPDGAAGLRMLEQYGGTVALVLMDVTMPGMSGLEAVSLLRKSGNRVPIVLSSGYEVDPSQVKTHDVSGVLEKPYDVRTLLAAVEQALGRR